MTKSIEEISLYLTLKFEDLDIKGTNVESFYNSLLKDFQFWNSELSYDEKFEFWASGDIDGNKEIDIQNKLSERTFIQNEITINNEHLKLPISPENREKVLIWIDYLKLKEKSLNNITTEIPKWTNPLFALYCVYKEIQLTEKYIEEHKEKLPPKISNEAAKQYRKFKVKANRTYIDCTSETKRNAEEQLKRLNNLKLIMESKNEIDSIAFNQLIEEIQDINTNIYLAD